MTIRRFAIVCIAIVLWPCGAVGANKASSGAIAIPKTTLEWPVGTSAVHLPFRSINGHIILRVKVGGRDVDMAFDSGAGMTVLNSAVFDEMAMSAPQNNPTTIEIGDVVLHNVAVISSTIMDRHEESDTTVVGLIGGDLMKHAVVRIDYDAATLDIIDPASFDAPPSATLIPIAHGRSVPIVSATIGDATGDDFVLDTGTLPVSIFHRFAGAHEQIFTKEAEFKGEGVRTSPICGTIVNAPYQVSAVQVGNAAAVTNWIVLLVPEKSCFNQPLDGLIGYDYLRFFIVTIDMTRDCVYLEKLESNVP